MKTQTIQQLILSRTRSLATFAAATLIAVSANSASAQSGGLLKYLSSPSGPSSTAKSPQHFTNKGENFRIVKSAAVKTAADVRSSSRPGSVQKAGGALRGPIGSAIQGQNPVQQVAFGCQSCGTNSCGGSCGSSASSFSYGLGVGNPCGNVCNPYRFVTVEGLYMRRTGEERFTLSPNFRLGEFDHELGSRITIGAVPDCVHGCEVTLTGPIEWDMSATASDPAGNLTTFLLPGNPISLTDLGPFVDSTFQSQRYTAEYWSVEANRTLVGWDVAKVLFGARYVDYDENYSYFGQAAVGPGVLQSRTENQMYGLQIGLDLLYPVCRFGYADFRGRAGGYLNFADSNVQYSSPTTSFANVDEDEELAGLFELGTGLRYELGTALSVRVGAEMWYLTGVATAPDQLRQVVAPELGRNVRMDDDIFFYGLTASATLKF